MTQKKRILQPINLIVFLIFALAAGVTACMPLFKGANSGLQLAWTGYLLAGILFLFFAGEKTARVKMVEKYLAGTKAGRFLTGCFLFLLCTGAGAVFRLWEMPGGIGAFDKKAAFHLAYYVISCLLVYLTAWQIRGFKGGAAAILLMILCPFFDFTAEYSIREYLYSILTSTAIFSISLANYFVEKKSVSLPDTLLTIFGAVSLAGAAFLHISAMFLIFPCIFLLIRKSGLDARGKREQRGLRSLLFEVFFICSLVVISLIYSVKAHNARIIELPIDYDFFRVLGNIQEKPAHVLSALLDKCTGLFTIHGQAEYYNGLLLGMLILGMIGAVLLFWKKAERRYFPVYLFNWYFFFSIALKEYAVSGLVLYVLLVYMVSGAAADLSETLFAGKKKKQEEPEAVVEAEEEVSEPEAVVEAEEEVSEPETVAEKEEEQPEPETVAEEEEEQPEPETVAEKEEEQPEPEAVAEKEEEQPEPETAVEETAEPEKVLSVPLEKQVQDLIKREDRILEIVEKQSVQISRLEEELREQRIRTKKMERHYRKELAITRNKKR